MEEEEEVVEVQVDESFNKFNWKIENVSKLSDTNHFSPIFTIGRHKWRLLAFCRECNMNDYLSVYVVSVECNNWRFAKFSLAIVDQTNNENKLKKDTKDVYLFTEGYDHWGFDDFIRLKELKDPMNHYIQNDACIIEVEFSLNSIQDFKQELVPMELTESVEEVQERSFGIETTTSNITLLASSAVCLDNNLAFVCAFCQTSTVSKVSGSMLHIANGEEVIEHEVPGPNVIHAHQKCIEWAPQAYHVGKTVKNLELELARASELKCCFCGLNGAALGCFIRSCRNIYHFPCAFDTSGCQWDYEGHLMLCPNHSRMKFSDEKTKKRKKLAEDNSSVVQSISVDDFLDTLDRVSGKDDGRHVCSDVMGDPRDVNFRSSLKEVEVLYGIVVRNNPAAKRYCDSCGFSSVFAFDFANADRGLVEAISERWWSKTKSFHFKEIELGILPVDWYMLTGVPTGDPRKRQVVMPQLGSELTYPAMDAIYFPDLADHGTWDPKNSKISLATLKNYIKSRENEDNRGCAEQLTRAFFLWCFGHFLLANSSGRVAKRWVLLLHDLDRVGEYDWGIASLGNTYKFLDEWSVKGKDISGMIMVLEYWYYYYFRNMQPVLCQTPGEHHDVFPKICLFRKENIKSRKRGQRGGQRDTKKHSVSYARGQIDSRTSLSCIWQPWADSEHSMGEHYDHALQLSKRRVVFFDLEKPNTRASCYLAERFQRQIIGEIVVPANPPNLQSVVDREIVGAGANHYFAVTESQYNRWWKNKSVGSYLTESHHSQNVDETAVGSTALSRHLLPDHSPPNLISQNYAYGTQNEPLPQLPEIEFTLPFLDAFGTEEPVEVPRRPCPYNFSTMGLTLEDCFSYMSQQYSFQVGVREVVRLESLRRASTSCTSCGESSSSVPSVSSQQLNN